MQTNRAKRVPNGGEESLPIRRPTVVLHVVPQQDCSTPTLIQRRQDMWELIRDEPHKWSREHVPGVHGMAMSTFYVVLFIEN